MNVTKTDYKTLKFESKPMNLIKNWAILPLTEDGQKNYCEKNGPSTTFLYKPTIKMMQNIYDKKDGLNNDNYKNVIGVFDENNNKIEDIKDEQKEQEEINNNEELNENENDNLNNKHKDKDDVKKVADNQGNNANNANNGGSNNALITTNKDNTNNYYNTNKINQNQNHVNFKINDADIQETENKQKTYYKLDYMPTIEKALKTEKAEKASFYKTGFFSTHKRSNSNIFSNNSNGVERILGSNELNFRCTTNQAKINKIYNNSIKNYEKNLGHPSDTQYGKEFVKQLESIIKKIDTPTNFFGVTPTSNIYLFSKKRRDKSLEGKGTGFESFNPPRVVTYNSYNSNKIESLRKSSSDIQVFNNSKFYSKTITNALKISAGINTAELKMKNLNNNLDIEIQDEDNDTEILCKKENMKLKKILSNYTDQSNFLSKLPTISRIKENPKLKKIVIKSKKNNFLTMSDNVNQFNQYNTMTRSSSTARNSFGGRIQY